MRGARQVGKTFIVRQLAELFQDFVEVNFELYPDASKIFDRDLVPERIIRDLALFIGKRIIPGETLLFFDEIQVASKTIQSLRYFYELMPQMHVISAGSLIDFELEKIGIPVGRVSSYYMYPLSFMEFLAAKNEDLLIEAILEHKPESKFNEAVHDKLLNLTGEYFAVGGMPEVVKHWIDSKNLSECASIQQTIIDSFKQDFNKYAKKFQIKYVELLFNTIPALLAQKFKFNNVPGDFRKRELMPALDLLIKAGVAHKIIHSPASGLPLGAEANHDHFKMIFLDVALAQAILGLDTTSWLLEPTLNFINKGAITEALVGQELLVYSSCTAKPQLYYWHRENRASSAEVDYIIQKQNSIIPIEVKSGAPGTLKSLRLFLESHKNSEFGIRFSSLNYAVDHNIHTYPLYAVAKAVML